MGDVTPIQTREMRLQLWRDKLKEAEAIDRDLEQLSTLKSKLNKQKGAIFDEVETNGISRNAFKEVLRQRKMDEDKRTKFRESYAEGSAANGWAQMDFVGHGAASDDEPEEAPDVEQSDDDFLADLHQRLGTG